MLEHADLSRSGRGNLERITALAHWARETGKRTVLVWDLLADDTALANGAALVRRLLELPIDAIRVQDPGIAAYVARAFPQLQLQLILEVGNHNRGGIEAWIRHLKPARVVLSNEIPLKTLASFCTYLGVETEILALGRLLIFYSPRQLVTPVEEDEVHDPHGVLQRFATEAVSGKHFPIVENRHGSFMYYEKDLFLVPHLSEIEAAGLTHVRLDLAPYEEAVLQPLVAYLAGGQEADLASLKSFLAPRLTRGFFKSNRTDKQFARLTNPNLAFREDLAFVGTVVETAKKKYTAIHTQVSLSVGDTLCFAIPEGSLLAHEVHWLRDGAGNPVAQAEAGLWLMDHVRGVSAGSMVYRGPERGISGE